VDHEVVLARSLAAVFEQLAAPLRLGDWLPEVVVIAGDPGEPCGIGTVFGLRLRRGGQETSGTGELTAFEPPRSVAYRLVFGPNTCVLRVTCVNFGAPVPQRISGAAAPAEPTLRAVGVIAHIRART
jgi:hypothetical protein